ncbi:MAG: plastocyanin/azurin family copper-binding protein [Thaumarchaeota archaeon]|nr:plastocyanin/azurin family copper-binding protein [Nitrososphaerota archaeon]
MNFNGRRDAISNTLFAATTVVLLLFAASGFDLYLTRQPPATQGLTSISFTTVTTTSNSTITTVSTLLIPGTGGKIVTVTKTASGNYTGFGVNGTLIIIPNGVSTNSALNFTPSKVKVIIGVNNTVTWLNQDTSSQHTVVTESAPTNATYWGIVLQTGQTYSVTLTVPGVYNYYCMWHPGWMKAQIIVASK